MRLPLRPDFEALRRQADQLWLESSPQSITIEEARDDLARRYGVPNWARLEHACAMVQAIWSDDIETIERMIAAEPQLLHENALGTARSNWGPPLAFASNLGRTHMVRRLAEMGARDLTHGFERAVLQGQIETAELLHELLGRPVSDSSLLAGPAYTLNVEGTALLFRTGARATDESGGCLAPVNVVLESDSRKPEAKHSILELYVQHGLTLPDTPVMALHRGRLDLLERHLEADPRLLVRTFRHEEIYPPELGCRDPVLATQGTPLAETTLLHMCVDYDEFDLAVWLIERGADVNAIADIDADGFGGHTPLFNTVVSQPNFWMNLRGGGEPDRFARLLLDRGADPDARASIRKQLHPGYGEDEVMREFRDVTPLSWGRRFHRKEFVSDAALGLIAERGGRE